MKKGTQNFKETELIVAIVIVFVIVAAWSNLFTQIFMSLF